MAEVRQVAEDNSLYHTFVSSFAGMGRIEEGKVSGKLPKRLAFAVNYPGYPPSVDSAIRTLGGDEGLEKARQSEANFLELKYRPDDPYAHPAFGELRHSSDLVLLLSKNSRTVSGILNPSSLTNSNLENVDNEESTSTRRVDGDSTSQIQEVRADIVARVEHTYSFEGMADYQFVVAVHANATKAQKRKDVDPSRVSKKGGLLDVDDGEVMILVPPLFSVKDMPEEMFLRPGAGKKTKLLAIEDGAPEDSQAPCLALDFKIKKIPPEGNWEHKLARGSEPWMRTAALVRLFQERPIWTKSMLNERLIGQGITVTDYYLRSLLFRIAYYFGNGPFRHLWIRNGYDPRLDPESRANQMIDFRVPAILRGGEVSPAEKMWTFSDMCAFKYMPLKKFTQFQIIDLQDDDIQAQIERPPDRSTCSETSGWFRLSTIKRLRQIVRVRFLALYPGEVARDLEAAERKDLEHFKSAVNEEDTSLDGETTDFDLQNPPEAWENDANLVLEVSKGKLSVQDQFIGVELDVNEDEDEEDEEEEEDIEEDVDQLDEAGLKAIEEEEDEEEEEDLEEQQQSQEEIAELEENPNKQGHLNPADNIPNNYLQALLGKFSANTSNSNNDLSNAADFDEYDEYTIYEPEDEDDNDT